jgi:hypothetical protein
MAVRPEGANHQWRRIPSESDRLRRLKTIVAFHDRYVRMWHIPEEAVSTGKVRSLGMTGRVENVS